MKSLFTAVFSFCILHSAPAFEGRITAVLARGGQATPLLYTAGTNYLRMEVTASSLPNPVDLLDLNSGELTLLFPNNRSFVKLKPAVENAAAMPPGFPAMPAMPPGVGPQPGPSGATPSGAGGTPALPAMPMMPPPMMGKMELKATGEKTNLLGLACEKYELKQRGETLEVWATDKLFPFQPYLQNQPHRFGPQMIEEQWGGLLKAKKLFPLLAVLRFDSGQESYRFEVQAITPEKIKADDEAKLFQPPADYQQLEPLPF